MRNAIFILRLSGWLYVLIGLGIGIFLSPVGYPIAALALLLFLLAKKVGENSKFALGATCLLFIIYVFSIFLPLGVWGLVSLWRDPTWRSA